MMAYDGSLPVQPEVDEEQRRRIVLCDELFGRAPGDEGVGQQVAVAVDDIGIAGDRIKGRSITRARFDRGDAVAQRRSEEHTSELQSLMRISYAVFCLKNK